MIEDENTDERMRGGIYTQWNITQPKMNEIMPYAATWMDLEIIIQSEVSQIEKDKCTSVSLLLSYGLCGRGRGWEDLGEWH